MRRHNVVLPSWTKWVLLALILILVALIIFFTVIYNDIQNSKTFGFQAAEERVLEETDVSEVVETMRYHGEVLHHVVFGKNRSNETLIVFVPEDRESELTVVNKKDIEPVENVRENWLSECANCELIDIVPAILNNDPLWEITFYDEAGRYVLNYVSIFDGSKYEEFRFRKMFD